MTRGVLSRARAFGNGAVRLARDLFFSRLAVMAVGLWRDLRLLSLLLAALLLCCLAFAGLSAKTVYLVLRPATEWPVGPAIAAALAFIVILELCAASVMALLRGLLRLSYDVGRHRLGTLLTLATLLLTTLALLDLRSGGTLLLGVPVLSVLALVAVVAAFWFDRAYRRAAYPRFRDFHGDVVDARQHLARTSHGG
jgi:hypothetical protein